MHKENTPTPEAPENSGDQLSGFENLPPENGSGNLEDLAGFELAPGQESILEATPITTKVPVGKPRKDWFCRTASDLDRWKLFTLLELKDDNEIYLVHPKIIPTIKAEGCLFTAQLVPSINTKGIPFIWPVRLPDSQGKINDWHKSSAKAAELARHNWIRCVANRGLGGYDVTEAPFQNLEPAWPKEKDSELIKIAFEGKTITDRDHLILKRLRGEEL